MKFCLNLNYWLRDGKNHNAEVDYIVERDPRIIAIEVKAGAAGKIRSLHQWMLDCHYKKKVAVRFNLSVGERTNVIQQYANKELNYELLSLPLYMIEEWPRFI